MIRAAQTSGLALINILCFSLSFCVIVSQGALQAGVKVGSIVYIAGAGPVGLCAAASSFLLGAACVFIADNKPDRLKLAEKIGCKTIDLSKSVTMMLDSDVMQREQVCRCSRAFARPPVVPLTVLLLPAL